MGLVLPTLSGRIRSLDVARGVAILGILLANIGAFGLPFLSYEATGLEPDLTAGERIVEALRLAFVTGKFRSLLAILFGVGLYLQFKKRESAEGAWPWGYVKRTLWLMAFGACHALFFWFGDILFIYAICALIVVPMVRLKWQVLFGIALGLLSLSVLIGVGLSATQAGGASAEDAKSLIDMAPVLAPMFDPAAETALFAEGAWTSQLLFRLILMIFLLFQIILAVPHVVGLMIVGFLLGQSGILTNPTQNPKLTRRLLTIGFVGLVINCTLGVWQYTGAELAIDQLAEMGLASLLSIGYLIVIAITCQKSASLAGKLIGNVGKMALTCYLGQTLLATFFFYSWGLGYFGQFNNVQLLGVVAAIWAINIAGATLWLRYFTMGPIEFLWRRLSYRSKFSIRRGEEPVVAPPPPPENPPTGPAFG